jgi:hypothetical protein
MEAMPLAVPVRDLKKYGGPCRSEAYVEAKAGRLKLRKRGRMTIVLMDDLRAYLKALPELKSTVVAQAPTAVSQPAAPARKRRRRR